MNEITPDVGGFRRALVPEHALQHELRQPLLSLLGHAELLQDLGPVLTDEARKPLARVLRAGERLRLALDSVSAILSGGDQRA